MPSMGSISKSQGHIEPRAWVGGLGVPMEPASHLTYIYISSCLATVRIHWLSQGTSQRPELKGPDNDIGRAIQELKRDHDIYYDHSADCTQSIRRLIVRGKDLGVSLLPMTLGELGRYKTMSLNADDGKNNPLPSDLFNVFGAESRILPYLITSSIRHQIYSCLRNVSTSLIILIFVPMVVLLFRRS